MCTSLESSGSPAAAGSQGVFAVIEKRPLWAEPRRSPESPEIQMEKAETNPSRPTSLKRPKIGAWKKCESSVPNYANHSIFESCVGNHELDRVHPREYHDTPN